MNPWCRFRTSHVPGGAGRGMYQLKLCASHGCNRRFIPKKTHQYCCSACEFGASGQSAHSNRCQKQQRRLGRSNPELIREAVETCGTPTCVRLSSPGYSTCCSKCKSSSGHRHSSRYDFMASSSSSTTSVSLGGLMSRSFHAGSVATPSNSSAMAEDAVPGSSRTATLQSTYVGFDGSQGDGSVLDLNELD